MSDKVEVQFGANVESAVSGIKQVEAQVKQFADSVESVGSLFSTFGLAFAAIFAVDRIADFMSKMGEMAETIERTSAMLGISSAAAQEWSYAVEQTGGDAQGFANMAERLQLSLQHAQNATSTQAQALRALGLSAKDLIGLSLDQQMDKIANAVSNFADGGNKTAIVMALLGRNGAQMIPILDEGAAGLEKMRQRAEDVGSVLDGKTVASLSRMEQSSKTLQAAISGLAGELAGRMADSITQFDNDLATTIGNVNIAIATHTLWDRIIVGLQVDIEELGQTIANIGTIAHDVFTGAWGQIAADTKAGNDRVAQIMQEGQDKINAIAKRAVDQHKQIIAGRAEADNATVKPQAPPIDVNSKDESAAEEKDIDASIKAWEDWLAKQKTIHAEDEKLGLTTAQAKLQADLAASNQAYQGELAALQEEAALGNLSVAQRADVLDKIKELESKHATEVAQIEAQGAEQVAKQWETAFNTVESSFNSQLRGLLAGTESWQQAWKKMMGDMVIKFIEAVEQMVVKWVAGEVAKTVASEASAAAQESAQASVGLSGLAAAIANAMRAIGAGAGATSAQVSAEVAPAAGPAAPAIGAAAGASVMGTALGFLGSMETGGWEIPAEGMAHLHPGEMVVPRNFADGLRESGMIGGEGKSINNHFHVNAMDSQSVKRLFEDNEHHLIRTINQAIKRGAHLNVNVGR